MQTIGLIAAMPQESNALLRVINGTERIHLGALRGYRFELAGRICILITSGMGMRRAAEATRLLVKEFNPCLLVSFGIAGAVETELEIGDVVASEAFCELKGSTPGSLLPLGRWPEKPLRAISQILAGRNSRLFNGTAVTTRGSQVTQEQLGDLTHPVLEMETAGIATVAAEKEIPLLSLRAISDGPRAPIPFDLGEMLDEDANLKYGKLLKELFRRPSLLLQANQMQRNSRIAEDNAALALVSALTCIPSST
jgi:adenosylhomocysteine nucleosidase